MLMASLAKADNLNAKADLIAAEQQSILLTPSR